MKKNIYLKNSDVSQFITFLVDAAIEGKFKLNHKIHIKDKRVPKGYAPNRVINNLKDAFESYFWDGKTYDQTSVLLSGIQTRLCDAYFSEQEDRLLHAVDDVLDWGLMQIAANHNKRWARKQAYFVKSMQCAMKELTSDDPDATVFNDKDCRMNAGFTKVYALLHPGILIYDGRVGAALGYLAREYLVSRKATTVPKELQFPWAIGVGKSNRDPSCGQFIFPALQAVKQCGHAEWNIKANWIIQAVVEQCIKEKVTWLTGNPVRQLEAALFMIGYELPVSSTTPGNKAQHKIATNLPYVLGDSSTIKALACVFDVNELIDYMRNKGVSYLIQGQQQSSFAEHSKKSSLDYWIRGKAKNRDQKQADNNVIDQLVQTGYFLEDAALECPDTGNKCKGIVLVTE